MKLSIMKKYDVCIGKLWQIQSKPEMAARDVMRKTRVRFSQRDLDWMESLVERTEEAKSLQSRLREDLRQISKQTGLTKQQAVDAIEFCQRRKDELEADATDTRLVDIKAILTGYLQEQFSTNAIEAPGKDGLPAYQSEMAQPPKNAAEMLAEEHRLFVESFNQGALCTLDGMTFMAPSSVYKPTEGSSTKILWQAILKLMRINMPIIRKQYETRTHSHREPGPSFSILEIGAGSGAVSIGLKKRFPWAEVTATDISPRACAAMECNALLHHTNIRVVEGDVWEPFTSENGNNQFDCVLFNLPLLDKPLEDQHELALCDPDGKLLHQFLMGLPGHINPNGFAVFLHANFSAPLPMLPGVFNVVCESQRTADTVFRALSWRS